MSYCTLSEFHFLTINNLIRHYIYTEIFLCRYFLAIDLFNGCLSCSILLNSLYRLSCLFAIILGIYIVTICRCHLLPRNCEFIAFLLNCYLLIHSCLCFCLSRLKFLCCLCFFSRLLFRCCKSFFCICKLL